MNVEVAGVDGCRGGWLCVMRQAGPPFDERFFLAKTIGQILNHPRAPQVIAIDIPIGLPERISDAGRGCDAAARKVLGKRASAVFPVPARAAVYEPDYARACMAAFATSDPPRKISKQMFHLFPKIREVDGLMTPSLQSRVFECHPEVSFFLMNGRQELREPKKRAAGQDLRRVLLIAQGYSESFVLGAMLHPIEAGPDDFLDACACAWTAVRIFKGEVIRFPATPALDAKGLRMEILA